MESDIKNYKVYYRSSTDNYDIVFDVGNVTEYVLRNLNENTDYYFAVTASDTSGNESDFSDRLGYFFPDDGIPEEEDNCPNTPNGSTYGTCVSMFGNITISNGIICTSDSDCGIEEICQMNQEDFYPLEGNDIGDACECYGDFNHDGRVDLFDLLIIKNQYLTDCTGSNFCESDITGDEKVDMLDLVIFRIHLFRYDCPYDPSYIYTSTTSSIGSSSTTSSRTTTVVPTSTSSSSTTTVGSTSTSSSISSTTTTRRPGRP